MRRDWVALVAATVLVGLFCSTVYGAAATREQGALIFEYERCRKTTLGEAVATTAIMAITGGFFGAATSAIGAGLGVCSSLANNLSGERLYLARVKFNPRYKRGLTRFTRYSGR